MRYLLDTHTWLWWLGDRHKLSAQAVAILEDADNECFLSIASAWEIAIKSSIGKLPLPLPLERFPAESLTATETRLLDIKTSHLVQVAALPFHHRDPFDRLIIAQAKVEGLRLVTADEKLALYNVDLISAR